LGLFFYPMGCKTEKPVAEAIRLFFRMCDADNSFESLIRVRNVVHKRLLYRLGQLGVERGGWLYKVKKVSNQNQAQSIIEIETDVCMCGG